MNVILVVKAVQTYEGRSSEPPKQWPEEMVNYPGGKITIDDMEEIQVPDQANHNVQASGVRRSDGDNDTFYAGSLDEEPYLSSGPTVASVIDYNDVDSVAPVS